MNKASLAEIAEVLNRVQNLGKFETSNGSCFNTSQSATDKSIIIPAIQEQLRQRGANVADNVSANERWLLDFFLGLFLAL